MQPKLKEACCYVMSGVEMTGLCLKRGSTVSLSSPSPSGDQRFVDEDHKARMHCSNLLYGMQRTTANTLQQLLSALSRVAIRGNRRQKREETARTQREKKEA